MRHLLNTLYVFTEDSYLSLEGENVVVRLEGAEIGRVPLHNLESIVCFSHRGASPYLMGACVNRGIALSFFNQYGRFLATVKGMSRGNVLLRKAQYRISENEDESLTIAKNFIAGKVYNCRSLLLRLVRDHGARIEKEPVHHAVRRLSNTLQQIERCRELDELRGYEGEAASVYFGEFNTMILRETSAFRFVERTKRPPTDPVNAMLSLFYTILAQDCASALEGVGLDSYVGFLHADRPGRSSLALDLIEELRPIMVDRFILTSINNRVIKPEHFYERENREVRLTDEGRRLLFSAWQERKRERITHPYLKEKIPRGLLPHIQSLLLARFVRGDIDAYPPVFWK